MPDFESTPRLPVDWVASPEEAEALGRISPKLTAISARLCVIPQNRAEYLCYEISAANADGDFLVYVDARTGVERELMQVISKSNGTLVM